MWHDLQNWHKPLADTPSDTDSNCVCRATARITPPCCAASCWASAWTLTCAWALTPRGRRTPGSWPVAVMEPSLSGKVWQHKGWLCYMFQVWFALDEQEEFIKSSCAFISGITLIVWQIPAQSHRSRCPTPGPPAQTVLPLQDGGLRLQPPDLPGQLSAVWCCDRVHLWLPGSVMFNALVRNDSLFTTSFTVDIDPPNTFVWLAGF